MKVNDPNNAGISGLGRTQELTQSGSSARTKGSKSDRGDEVSLSNLSTALSASQSDSPEHSARLAEISAAVASGRHHVNAHALSGRIISSHLRA